MSADVETLEHLHRWIERQFRLTTEQTAAIFIGMLATYASDAKFYGARGWWKVWDDTVEHGAKFRKISESLDRS